MKFSMKHWYWANYRDPHNGLKLMSDVSRGNGQIMVLKVPMPVPGKPDFCSFIPEKLWQLFWKFYAHLLLVMRLWQCRSPKILVREFLTLPLLAIAILIFPLRRQTWFLVQHNLNNVLFRRTERWAFWMMNGLGFRFCVFEDSSAWFSAMPKTRRPALVKSLLHPMPPWGIPGGLDQESSANLTVGFVGNYRVEKSPEWAIERLLEYARNATAEDKFHLLIGSPDARFLGKYSQEAITLDTTAYSAFRRALLACDVLVLPYAKEHYFLRDSGVVPEAIASGCAIVVPDYPLLRHQVTVPAPVGCVYSGQDDFIGAILEAIYMRKSPEFAKAVQAHIQARSHLGIQHELLKL